MISRDTSSGGRSTFFSPPLPSLSLRSLVSCDVFYQFLSLSPLPPRAKICRFDRFFIFFWKDATGGWVRKRWKRRRWTRGGEDGGGGDGIVKIVTHTRETEHTCERHDTPPSTTGFDDQYRHRGQTKRDVNSR